MPVSTTTRFTKRYGCVTHEKAGGATYTPKALADFVAAEMVQAATITSKAGPVRLFDPAVGEGELLVSLLEHLPNHYCKIEVHGFDTNERALRHTEARLRAAFPDVTVNLQLGNFLDFVLNLYGGDLSGGLFEPQVPEKYDLIIANPPYVRTQIMGAMQAQKLAEQFGLKGRVDLYYAFILGMAKVLRPHGVAGMIVSNRFMTTKAGAGVRQSIRDGFYLRHVWDLGDTKLFDAAVLPAVLLAEGRNGKKQNDIAFTSIYETRDPAEKHVTTAISALKVTGIVQVADGRRFYVQHGKLGESEGQGAIWRVTTEKHDEWLATVDAHTWCTFGQVGKVRVGVKTCADKVFIRTDWNDLPEHERPELLRPLTTHHIARRYKADTSAKQRRILYPHESKGGKRQAVDLDLYPLSKAYLRRHQECLQRRQYVLDAGRQWYEIWVPQDPAAWDKPKLVFRDISERPCFWIDREGSVINGDCYWIIYEYNEDEDLLWLAAAVGNSTFIEVYYDHMFNNKLYAGRRRFITQYVEKFPLPNPKTTVGKTIIDKAKQIFAMTGKRAIEQMETELDQLVWKAFGLDVKKVGR